jgi:hypothetical protein
MVILADLNPIPLAVDYRPGAGLPIATRIKLDQRTPVRGAVQMLDGNWLVSGGWIDAAGGDAPPRRSAGCGATGPSIWARCAGGHGMGQRAPACAC